MRSRAADPLGASAPHPPAKSISKSTTPRGGGFAGGWSPRRAEGIGRRLAAATPVLTESATAKASNAKSVDSGQMRVLQIEALGFQITEHGFDGPSLTIAGQRIMRLAGTGQRQQVRVAMTAARFAQVGMRL
jgi:hypothetical protein